MKTNYLSALALIGLLAFSSCSKDDATTDNKTETPKSTIVLTQDQNVAATTNFAQNVNLVAEFDNLLQSTSLLKGMATTATGPEICGQKPAGVFNPTTASYDFKYDFGVFNYDYGGSDSCKLNDVVIKGKLTISVDAKNNITLKFDNFYRSDLNDEDGTEVIYNGTIKAPISTIADKRTYIVDLFTKYWVNANKVDKIVSLESEIKSTINFTEDINNAISASLFNSTYKISKINSIIDESAKKSQDVDLAYLTVSGNNIIFEETCKQKIIGGSLSMTDNILPKNNSTVTFGDCASKKWTILNDGKEYFITF